MVICSSTSAKWAAGAVLAGLSLLMTGCGIQDLAPETATDTPMALAGIARGGQQPIVGATVTLYATQASGYGGTALQLGTPVTTGAGGTFSFNSQTITCPAGQQAYITSNGGNPGAGTNSNALLMAALGPCANLTKSTFVNIDEVTTVASAYALSGFTKISGATVNVTTSATNNNGSSGTGVTGNYAGLAHAFVNAANLANTTNGTANAATVASGSVGTVPQQEINFIADMMATCVNSTGGVQSDGSACGKLFALTPANNGTFPTNTLQSMLNLAQRPYISDANTTSLYALVTATPPFPTTYSAATGTTDWTLAIGYNYATWSHTVTQPWALTVDANDDAWVYVPPVTGVSPIVELSPAGVVQPLPTATCGTTCASNITGEVTGGAFDATGNLWLAVQTATPGLYKYVPSSGNFTFYISNVTGGTGSGTVGVPYVMAIDKAGDAFFAGYSQAGCPSTTCQPAELLAGGSALTVSFGSNSLVPQISGGVQGIAIDNTTNATAGNVIVAGTASTSNIGIFTPGSPTTPASYTEIGETGAFAPTGVAIDSQSNIWMVNSCGNCNGSHTSGLYQLNSAGGAYSGFPATSGLSNARYLAIDGAKNVFISDFDGDGIVEYNTTRASFVSPLPPSYDSGGGGYNSVDRNGISDSPRGIAIDSAGAIWTSNSFNDAPTFEVVQTLGVAAPTVAVQALGKYNTLP